MADQIGDAIEKLIDGTFRLTPVWQNSLTAAFQVPKIVRYTPKHYQFNTRAYTRSLLIGRHHRPHQLAPDDKHTLIYGISELFYEMAREPNWYP